MPRRVTVDTNLRIFQYKILNNVLYLNEKKLNLKLFFHLFVLFVIRKMKPLYTSFAIAIKQNLFGLNSIELRNTSSTKYATACFPWFFR